jgi:7,8-dihydroneopterin aldolase/epimerase/oxygenase
MPDLNLIRLKNAVFYAYHGVFKDEQTLGGRFEIDIDLYCDFSTAAHTDTLEQTVDYEKVYSVMRDLVQGKKYYLIESLAYKIADGILDRFPLVEKVGVRVRKNNPPVKGVIDSVEAEVTRDRH